MSSKRAVINAEKAVSVLPEKTRLTAFILRPDGKRMFFEPYKEEIVNRIVSLGGADVSGENALQMGFGICIPWETPQGLNLWLFVETIPNLCPLCLNLGMAKDEAELEILDKPCWVCFGKPFVSDPIPVRPRSDA